MSFLSNLFGGKKEDNALREIFEKIRRLLEDEEYQLGLVNPVIREMIASRPAYDRDPNGTGPFGFCETNPIPVNGPIGELAYLSKLETQQGERILFHRIGAINTIDVFEAVAFSGREWFIFFLEFYHPRKSRITPEGFRFTKEVGQFTGFHNYCPDFPYDFHQVKREDKFGLRFAYIAPSKITQQLEDRVFNRPLAHKAKLDIINSRLTSRQT